MRFEFGLVRRPGKLLRRSFAVANSAAHNFRPLRHASLGVPLVFLEDFFAVSAFVEGAAGECNFWSLVQGNPGFPFLFQWGSEI